MVRSEFWKPKGMDGEMQWFILRFSYGKHTFLNAETYVSR